jgi:hypothetical protein
MKKIWKILAVILLVILCLYTGIVLIVNLFFPSYTWNARTSYFPTNATQFNYTHELTVLVNGAPRKAYSDFSEKSVFVSIYFRPDILHTNVLLLHKEYTITGGDLDWNVQWNDLESLKILFTEGKTATNVVKKITFKIDSIKHQAVESPN